jgi:hypothetical protein
MAGEDPGETVPVTPAADEPNDVSPRNEALETSNPASTRDELWQVQFDPNAAREVAARHLGRLIYPSHDDWSHYVFHENDPKA